MDERFIERIYEAGAIPELWTGVLDDIGRLAGGIGAVLVVPGVAQWIATPSVKDMFAEFVSSGLIATNERTRRLVALDHPGFVTDQDVFALAEIPEQAIYRNFFIPRGGGFGVATVIPAPSGDTMIIHAERAFANGPVDRNAVRALDALRPHLARASLLSARLELQHAAGAAVALEILGLPGATLDRRGRVIFANRLFQDLVPAVIQDRRARVALANPDSNLLIADAIARLGSGGRSLVVQSIPIPARDDVPPLIIHVVPIHRAAHDVFASAAAMLIVTPVVPKEVPTAEIVQGLFDLTPAEARVAREIGRGHTAAEIAAGSGVQLKTVRTQIKAILGKTGLHRQADLLGLLRGVSAAMPPPEGG